MPTPAIYARVSTEAQADNHSLPAQLRACHTYCAAQGWPAPREFVEAGASAFNDDPESRPVFGALLAAAESRAIDRIVCLDIDRFARSTLAALLALGRLEAVGCTITFVNDPGENASPERKMMLTIKASFAELESAKKSARVKLSQELMRAEGKWLNRPPYGATIGPDQRLALNPATAPILRRILAEAASDSARQIAARLTDEGLATPGMDRAPGRWGTISGRWWPATIAQVVAQSGWLARQAEPWPSLWLAAKERPRRPKAPPGRALRFLSGLMRCRCGGVITYSGRRGPLDRTFVQCHGLRVRPSGVRCPYRKTYADVYEARVLAALLALPDPARWRVTQADDTARETRAALDEEYRRLADVYRAGIYTKARFDVELAGLDGRKAALPSGSPRVVAMRDRWPRLVRALPALPPAEANVVARELIERVILAGDDAEIVWRAEFVAAFGTHK